MTERLRVEKIRVSLGKVEILSNFSLTMGNGEMVGLIGRNGAGKTTLLRTVLGILQPHDGDVSLNGKSLLRIPTYRRAAFGIGYMPEDRGLIGALTVQENLAIPVWARGLNDLQARLDRVAELVPELRTHWNAPALSLSGGQQKLVALGRASMCGEKLLLLDEPFEGVSPVLAQRLVEAIGRARAQGASILLAQSDRKGRPSDFDRFVYIERGTNAAA